MSEDGLVTEAQELYALTPAEFTGARNEAAKRLKDTDRELSDRVKALRRPTTAAWVVNMLVRHRTEEMHQVLDLGESLRQAQADLDGDALRELTRQRRRLIGAVAGQGRALARDHGTKVSEAVQRQVEETLHAAMIDTDAAAAVRSGLLVDSLSATGVGSLKVATAVADHTALGGPGSGTSGSGAKAARGSRGLSVVPEPDPEERHREERREARAAAKQSVREAKAELGHARKTFDKRSKKVADLQASTLQVNGEIDELRRRIDELEGRLEEIDDQVESAREKQDQAAASVAAAESALGEAQSLLEDLTD